MYLKRHSYTGHLADLSYAFDIISDYTPLTRLLHASCTPLTRLLHASAMRSTSSATTSTSYTPLTRLLHASYTPLTRLSYAFDIISDYLPLMHALVKKDPFSVLLSRRC